jgi:hypothetical protein
MGDKSEEIQKAEAFFDAVRNRGNIEGAYRAYTDYIKGMSDVGLTPNDYLKESVEKWYRKAVK